MEKNIAFKIIAVKTEHFEFNSDNFKDGKATNVVTDIQFKAGSKNKQIGSFASFTFNCEGNPFVIIKVSCHFGISPESWENCKNENNFIFPKDFMIHLAMITIGTARGVVHAKTDSKFLLPTINVNELVKEDIVFTFED